MIPVYQNLTVNKDGVGNCFNACIASILEIPIEEASDILPNQPGDWRERWRLWLADKRLKLVNYDEEEPPSGYSICTITTDRKYPENHRKHGRDIFHCAIALDGKIIHDPFPGGSNIKQIFHYEVLEPMDDLEINLHIYTRKYGICIHGYKLTCPVCKDE